MKHCIENRLFPKALKKHSSRPSNLDRKGLYINAGWRCLAHPWMTRHGVRALCLEVRISISRTFVKLSLIMEMLTQPAISNHDIKQAQSQQRWLGAKEERLASQERDFRLWARRVFFFSLKSNKKGERKKDRKKEE